MKWISVKDRLPKVDDNYPILLNARTGPCVGCLISVMDGGLNWSIWAMSGSVNFPLEWVTHWQYLPEPPKEVER